MATTYQKGDRVLAKGKPGTVAFVRMAPPDFREVAAVSVVLDERRAVPGYSGTVFAAADLEPNAHPALPAGSLAEAIWLAGDKYVGGGYQNPADRGKHGVSFNGGARGTCLAFLDGDYPRAALEEIARAKGIDPAKYPERV